MQESCKTRFFSFQKLNFKGYNFRPRKFFQRHSVEVFYIFRHNEEQPVLRQNQECYLIQFGPNSGLWQRFSEVIMGKEFQIITESK